MKLTKNMVRTLNWLNQGCDQDELDKRSVNALITRGLVYQDVHYGHKYKTTVKGEYAYATCYEGYELTFDPAII